VEYLKHFGHLTRKERQLPIEVLRELDDLAEKIDRLFASFNATCCGACKEWPWPSIAKSTREVNRGCCNSCAHARGYFGYNGWPSRSKSQKRVTLRKRYWVNDHYGFFNPETLSCNLPRVRRSWTCTGAVCDSFPRHLRNRKDRLVRKFITLKTQHGFVV